MSHAIERTNPVGQPFRGRCIKCGAENLTTGDALKDCPQDAIVSDKQALLSILGTDGGGGSQGGKRMSHAIDAHTCTPENPWRKGMGKRGIHPSAVQIRQKDGYPGGDLVDWRCPICGVEWTEELPQ